MRFPKSILALYDAFGGVDTGEVTSDSASPDSDGGLPRALITTDGRAVVTDVGLTRQGGVWGASPRVVTIPLAGGTPEVRNEGAQLREPDAVTPLITAEGTLGLAWADNDDRDRDGRLHLAIEGALDGNEPPAPEVRVIAPKRRVLAADEALRLAIRCSAACEVVVQVGGGGLLAAGAEVRLTRAGEKQIQLQGLYQPLARLNGGPVKVRLAYGAPGARRATQKTVMINLRRLPDVPRPRVLDAVARRVGKAIVVTWRTDRNAKPSNFFVSASRTRNDPLEAALDSLGGLDGGDGDVKGHGRRFSIRIEDGGIGRYVKITAHVKGARKTETTVVRVRG